MSPMTSALIHYWHRLPAETPAARRKSLEATRERVRSALERPSALVPFALGDVDDGIVAAATRMYFAAVTAVGAASDTEVICEVTDWVRRGLALNRGAVFGALLTAGDDRLAERLAALRLQLSAAEVEAACRVIGAAREPRVAAFVQEWLAVIAGSPLQRESRLLAGLLESARSARAA